MKLVILTSRFPYPLEKGDKLRLFHQIKGLALKHEIILCALSRYEVPLEDRKQLEPYCSKIFILRQSWMGTIWSCVQSIFSLMPMQVALFYETKLHRHFIEIVNSENPDHIYFQLIRTATYVDGTPTTRTLDYMDNFSLWTRKVAANLWFPLNWLLNMEARKVALFEKAVYPKFESHCIISTQDKDQFGFSEKDSLLCIPNGVDVDFFQPLKGINKEYDICFAGNMGYYNNVEAAKYLVKKILPKLETGLPGVKILIAGARPAREVKKLQSSNVMVSGWVNDIRQSYSSSRVFVAPILLAVGLQNKILEAMAMGLPCVTTSLVNEAIGAKPNEEILIADTAEQFASQIKLLLLDLELREQIGQRGLSFARKFFGWEGAVLKLHKLLMDSDRRIANNPDKSLH